MQDDLDDAGCVRLVCGVVLQACKDYTGGDVNAGRWLNDDAPTWLDAVGIELATRDLTGALYHGQHFHRLST
jgi:hypothetical protein